jgi:hypothetical protein
MFPLISVVTNERRRIIATGTADRRIHRHRDFWKRLLVRVQRQRFSEWISVLQSAGRGRRERPNWFISFVWFILFVSFIGLADRKTKLTKQTKETK